MSQAAVIGFFLVLTVLFPLGALFMAWLFRPKPRTPGNSDKYAPYECGVDTKGPTWTRFRSNFFLYGLVFLVFDVETVFLLPWAVHFQKLGFLAFVEMIVFIFILILGLWYAWKAGALEWH